MLKEKKRSKGRSNYFLSLNVTTVSTVKAFSQFLLSIAQDLSGCIAELTSMGTKNTVVESTGLLGALKSMQLSSKFWT